MAHALALLQLLAIAGCAAPPRREAPRAQARDFVDSLAQVVEDRFRSTDDPASGEESRRAVSASLEELVRAVLAGQRPAGGWTPDGLVAALLDRRVAAQAREIARGREPWILLVSDPARPEAPEFAFLVHPKEALASELAVDPFLNQFQIASWSDSLGPALMVAGTRRSPGGPQPAAWVFRLPAQPVAGARGALRWSGEWGLAGPGPAHVVFTQASPDSAPRVVVRDSSLPSPWFEECPSCPHVVADLEYRYSGDALTPERRQVHRTPYASFVGFVQALIAHDDAAALGYAAGHDVLDRARSLGFDLRPTGGLWRIAPGTSATSLDQTYLRGQDGAFRVLLAPGDTGFVVSSISPTTFKLD